MNNWRASIFDPEGKKIIRVFKTLNVEEIILLARPGDKIFFAFGDWYDVPRETFDQKHL